MRSLLAILLAACCALPAQAQLVEPDKAQILRAALPPVADPVLEKVLADPQLLLYTDAEMPPAYQLGARFTPVVDGVSTDGNFRFPWDKPGGLQRVKGVGTFRFLSLPKQPSGKPWPVVVGNSKLDLARDANQSLVWFFPIGAVIGEVLTQRGPDGKDYTFEIRTRTREADAWDVDIYRPFPTAASLAEGITALRPDWQQEPQLLAAVAQLTEPAARSFDTATLKDPRNVFVSRDQDQFFLPPLERGLVSELLTSATFESSRGLFFAHSAQHAAFAPSNKQGFHIVPANFDATFAGGDRQSCLKCHETAGANQVRFDGTWRGHIRGSDGIFSFYPVSLRSAQGGPVVLRAELLDAGLIARRNASAHPDSVYSTLPSLRHSK